MKMTCVQLKRMLLLSAFFISLAVIEGKKGSRVSYQRPVKQWVLLVASSKGWWNYRHQADVCHAYHTLRANGIPAENIITMMYDDIANNTQNPHKGAIYNQPGGPNVYDGVIKDYTGNDVSIKNVFNVLKGDKEAMRGIGSGRVIDSGPEDHIFVNIVDHGTTGALIFLDKEYMYANDLATVLRNMRKEKRFAKMVMYIEACEGGSMFDNIIDDGIDVFVTTASAPDESSYAYYCDYLDTCLGDMYSAQWLQNMDQLREEWSDRYVTLFKQYRHVRTNVNKSHVMIYGDFRLGFDRLSDYMGDAGVHQRMLYQLDKAAPFYEDKVSYPVKSRDVPLYLLRRKLSNVNDANTQREMAEKIQALQKGRKFVDETMDTIFAKIAGDDHKLYFDLTHSRPSLANEIFPCYKSVIEKFNSQCFNTYGNPYLYNHFYKLVNICIWNVQENLVSRVFNEVCGEQHRNAKEIY